MSGSTHAELRRALGAYALGALDPGERSRIEEHLDGCAACRDELASLAVLPGLLARLSEEEVSGDLLSVSAGHADSVIAALAEERRRQRRRLRAWQTVAAVAAAVAIGVAGVVLPPAGGPQGERYAVRTEAVHATATVEPREWGMQVELRAGGLPDAQGYTLWAVDAEEHRAYVASWADVDRADVTVTGSCYMAADDVVRLEIVDPDDRVLATLES